MIGRLTGRLHRKAPQQIILDVHGVGYRVLVSLTTFYALPDDLATKSGQVTNAVFGFTRMLIRLLKDYHPDGVAVACIAVPATPPAATAAAPWPRFLKNFRRLTGVSLPSLLLFSMYP